MDTMGMRAKSECAYVQYVNLKQDRYSEPTALAMSQVAEAYQLCASTC